MPCWLKCALPWPTGQFCGDAPKAFARVVEGLADPRGLVRFNFAEGPLGSDLAAQPFSVSCSKALARARECGGSSAAAKTLTPD